MFLTVKALPTCVCASKVDGLLTIQRPHVTGLYNDDASNVQINVAVDTTNTYSLSWRVTVAVDLSLSGGLLNSRKPSRVTSTPVGFTPSVRSDGRVSLRNDADVLRQPRLVHVGHTSKIRWIQGWR